MVITLDDNTEQFVISLIIIVLVLLLLGRSARRAPGLTLGRRVHGSEATLSRGRLFLVLLSQDTETVLNATLVALCLPYLY
jgi:hypothetical protein